MGIQAALVSVMFGPHLDAPHLDTAVIRVLALGEEQVIVWREEQPVHGALVGTR